MRSEQTAIEQPKITRAEAFDGDTFGITLESGHTILLELAHRIREPAFADLIKSSGFCKPYTDGKALCWPGGTFITLEEVLEMLLSPGDVTRNQSYEEDLR